MNRENCRILGFLFYVSLPILGGNYNPYEDAIASSECDVFFMDSPWPFNITQTHSHSISLIIPPPTQPPSVIPVAVTVTAKTIGAVASTTSIAAVSPGIITQANRIGTVTNVLACDDDSNFKTQPLDWSLSPTQISISDGILQYIDGAVVGNWALFLGIAATHTLLAKKIGETTLRYPGYLILPGLFLSSATAQSAVTMIRLGNTVEKTFGSISLLGQLGIVGWIARFLMPSRFGAVVKHEPARPLLANLAKIGALGQSFYNLLPVSREETLNPKWRSKEEGSGFIKCYGAVFRDYRQEWYGFIVPELLMTMASGTLGSFQINPESSCNALLYTSTGVYGLYALGLIALHPHRTGFNRIYFGSVAGIQFLALSIGVLQKSVPSLQNSTRLQAAAEGIPIALQYITLARSVYDLAWQFRSGYQYFRGKPPKADSRQQLKLLDRVDDDTEMLAVPANIILEQPLLDANPESPSSDSDSISLSGLNPAEDPVPEPLQIQEDPSDQGVPKETRHFIFNPKTSIEEAKDMLRAFYEHEADESNEDVADAPKLQTLDNSIL